MPPVAGSIETRAACSDRPLRPPSIAFSPLSTASWAAFCPAQSRVEKST